MRNRDTLSASFQEFTPGLLPTGNITRNTFATYFIDRQWQATFRGRFCDALGPAAHSTRTGG